MPNYDYKCEKCGVLKIEHSIKQSALTECPQCGDKITRLIGKNVNIIYKTGGFYCTDTKSSSSSESA